MEVSTVETNRDRDRDFSICQDRLLKPVEIFSTVKANLLFVSFEIFKIETFQLRLCNVEIFVEIVKTNRDLLRNLDFIKTFLIWKWLKVSTFWEISTRNMKKSTYFLIEIETNCWETTKFPGLDRLLDLDRDFWAWTLMLRQNWDFSTVEMNFF